MTSDPHYKLIEFFKKISQITSEQENLVREKFRLRRYKKRAYVFNEGDVHKYNSFIVEGALRLYMFDENFKEYSLHFAFENWWTGDLGSFVNNRPSRMCLQAFENTTVLQISYKDQLELLEAIPSLYKPYMFSFQSALMRANTRILDNISSIAEVRYEDFLNTYPRYLNRLPDKFIASYIGVTPEFYSKLKRESLRKYLNID